MAIISTSIGKLIPLSYKHYFLPRFCFLMGEGKNSQFKSLMGTFLIMRLICGAAVIYFPNIFRKFSILKLIGAAPRDGYNGKLLGTGVDIRGGA